MPLNTNTVSFVNKEFLSLMKKDSALINFLDQDLLKYNALDEDELKKFRELDINFLDQDLLKYDVLDIDELKRFSMLDINYLDFDLLPNILDESTAALAASQESMLEQKTMLPGYSEGSGLKYGIDENGKLILTKMANHVAQVIVDKEADLVLSITQDGSPLVQKVNGGGTTTITITQK
jgi:hypothetical protein